MISLPYFGVSQNFRELQLKTALQVAGSTVLALSRRAHNAEHINARLTKEGSGIPGAYQVQEIHPSSFSSGLAG